MAPPGKVPTRSLGPWMSWRTATASPSSSPALLTHLKNSSWVCWSPWEKLSLATFMPAATRSRTASYEATAGPRVAMILVLRFTR